MAKEFEIGIPEPSSKQWTFVGVPGFSCVNRTPLAK